MTITIETLKENRTQIIERITNEFGESEVKEVMALMAKTLPDVEDMFYSDLNDYIDQMFDMASFSMTRKSPTAFQSALSDASHEYMTNGIKNEY